jgi:ribonuclease I
LAVTAADSTAGLQKPKERKGAIKPCEGAPLGARESQHQLQVCGSCFTFRSEQYFAGDRSKTIRRTTKEPCIGGLATAGGPKKTIGDILESFVRMAVHAIVHADNNKVVKAEEVEMMDWDPRD